MADWTMGPTDETEAAPQLPAFDPTGFATVLTGERDGQRDGPHACLGADDAVGHELRAHGPRGRGATGGVGPRLHAGGVLDVGGFRAGGGGAETAMLSTRCRLEVATVRSRFVDGTVVDDQPVVSAATGQGWAVVAPAGRAHVETVTAFDAAGETLAEATPDDPASTDARERPTDARPSATPRRRRG